VLVTAISTIEDDNDKTFLLNLYLDYYGLVKKNIYNITHDVNHLEDLINDTFIKLIGKISLMRNMDSNSTAAYIVYTSRSVALDFIRHRNVEKKYIYFGDELDLAETLQDIKDDIEYRIIHEEEMLQMVKAILQLPPKHKYLLCFKYILEMSDREIAAMLNIAPSSVRQYLTRARREAKKLLDKELNVNAEQQSETNKEKAL